jgi:hypothetical protein
LQTAHPLCAVATSHQMRGNFAQIVAATDSKSLAQALSGAF